MNLKQVVRARVLVIDARRKLVREQVLEPAAERPRARELQLRRRHLDVGQERRGPGRIDQLTVDGRCREEPFAAGEAVPEDDLLERGVCRPVLSEHQHRDPGEVGTGVQANDVATVVVDVPRQPEARLEVVQIVRDGPIRWEPRLADQRRVERLGRCDEHGRVPGPLPADAEVQRNVLDRLPGVLNEEYPPRSRWQSWRPS